MEIALLRVFAPRDDKFTVGAVSGNVLYLTSLSAPVSGALWGIDLTKPAMDPKIDFASCKLRAQASTNSEHLPWVPKPEAFVMPSVFGSILMHRHWQHLSHVARY